MIASCAKRGLVVRGLMILPMESSLTDCVASTQLHSFQSRCSSSVSSNNKRRRGGRHFAYRKNEQARQEQARKERKSKQPKVQTPKAAPRGLPPALLAPTGSPHVYISRMALEGEISMAETLFTSYDQQPKSFQTHRFEYVSPHALNFEYPSNGSPEVAFLGRSNVGKSSLVNALMRRNLCQTSKSPGRTQLPYYYGLFPHQHIVESKGTLQPNQAVGYLVDLPGYGYGAAPKEVVEGWQAKTQEWLMDRRDAGALQRLFLLLDARRDEGPSTVDTTVIEWAEEAEIPFSLVLTKADRVSAPKVVKQVNDLCIRYATRPETLQSPIVHVTSASKYWGINELLQSIEAELLDTGEEDEEEEEEEEDG